MKEHYTPAEAAELTGASKPALRSYTNTYTRYFSTEATPEKGASRRFTAADLKLIAFIRQKTVAENASHEVTEHALQAGDLDLFDWQEPEQDQPQASDSASGETYGALIPAERLQAAQILLHDAQQRERSAIEREQALQDKISELERELGQASGELAGFKAAQYKAPAWWRALFGGRSAE